MLRKLLLLLALGTSSAAHAEWWEAKTIHFTVYSEGEAPEAKRFAERLERFAMAMRTMQRMPVKTETHEEPLTIFRWGDISDIGELAGARGVAGFFIPRASGSVAFAPAREGRDRSGSPGTRAERANGLAPETVLFHEYTHHFMMQYFPTAYPAWYIEGFAEVYATAELLDDGTFRIGLPANHRGVALLYDSPFPVKGLFEEKVKPEDTRHYYSVGWLLTHYLSFTPERAQQLRKYLTEVSRGAPSKEAAVAAFGDLDALNEAVTKYRKNRLMGFEVKPAGYVPPAVEVRQLNASEEAMILTKMRSSVGVTKRSAGRVAHEARERAAPYPNDAFVQLALAEAEFDDENLAAADAAANRALAAQPDLTDAMVFKGMILMKGAEKDPTLYPKAREWFVKANQINPNDPQALIANYLTFDKAGAQIPEKAVIGLERAYQLAPFDPGVRFLLARQLLRENAPRPARSILSPVAFSPHGGKTKEAAAKIIESIDAGDAPGALALADKQVAKADGEEDDS